MEIIVCLLTTFFFAALELRDIKIRSARKARYKNSREGFVVVPYLPHSGTEHETT